MAVALDSTAHPTGAGNISVTKTEGISGTWQTLVSPSFSTGAGPILIVVKLWIAGGAAPFPLSSLVITAGLTAHKRVNFDSVSGDGNAEIWTFFSLAGSLSTQTITATVRTSAANQQGLMDIEVWNGVPSSEAACIGSSDGFVDDAGSNLQISATVNAAATGSAITGVFGQDNDTTAQTANANTTPFDVTWTGGAGADWAASGWYKAGPTSAPGNVTVGASTSSTFGATAALEIKAGTGGGSTWTGTQSESATATDSFADAMAMPAGEVESAAASASFAPGVRMSASEAEAATANDAYALGLALGTAQAETTTPGVAFACSLAMNASQIESTIAVDLYGNGSTSGRKSPGFWPWWYRLRPLSRRRII